LGRLLHVSTENTHILLQTSERLNTELQNKHITCTTTIPAEHILKQTDSTPDTTTTSRIYTSIFSRTTWVSLYQKSKTSLNLNEANKRWWCFGMAVASTGPYANNLHLATTPTPHHSIFTGRLLFQQCQSIEGINLAVIQLTHYLYKINENSVTRWLTHDLKPTGWIPDRTVNCRFIHLS